MVKSHSIFLQRCVTWDLASVKLSWDTIFFVITYPKLIYSNRLEFSFTSEYNHTHKDHIHIWDFTIYPKEKIYIESFLFRQEPRVIMLQESLLNNLSPIVRGGFVNTLAIKETFTFINHVSSTQCQNFMNSTTFNSLRIL